MISARIAHWVNATRAEGPGTRMAIWFQGCPLRCADCCNPEMLPIQGGVDLPVEKICGQIESAIDDGIEGITLLGGEPFAQAEAAMELAGFARGKGLSVMVFSGFTLPQLRAREDAATQGLLGRIDLLVDGPFVKTKPDRRRRWVGSTNQQVHFLTDRYSAEDACWSQPNTIELRWVDGELHVNGFPAESN